MKASPLRLSTADADFEEKFAQRLHWSADTDAGIEQRVAEIIDDVRKRGDAAVLEYTARFDGVDAKELAALELKPAEQGSRVVLNFVPAALAAHKARGVSGATSR